MAKIEDKLGKALHEVTKQERTIAHAQLARVIAGLGLGYYETENVTKHALKALSDAGLTVVPIEPTDAMFDAFEDGYANPAGNWRDAYKAMVQAAQQQSKQDVE